MNKTVRKVFFLIATLVFVFLVWQLVFNDGGILKTVYNNIANGINGQWKKVAGQNATLLPQWTDSNAESNGTGFDIETK